MGKKGSEAGGIEASRRWERTGELQVGDAALFVGDGAGAPEADPVAGGDLAEVVVAGGAAPPRSGGEVGGGLVPGPPGADAGLGPGQALELGGALDDLLDGQEPV